MSPNKFTNEMPQNPIAEDEDIKSIKSDLKSIGKSLSSIFESLKKKITFQEYLEGTGEYIDERIIEISRNENLLFVSGNCFFSSRAPYSYIDVKAELYFKDRYDKWIKKVLNGTCKTSVFKPETMQKEIEYLKKQEMKITINPPKI